MLFFRVSSRYHLAILWLVGIVTIGLVTSICFALSVPASTTSFIYLMAIVLLSLWDSFVSSALFSVVAVVALDYFFLSPILSLTIASQSDIALFAAFLLTSFVITSLVRKLQASALMQTRQARLLDLTHDTVLVRDPRDVIIFWNRGAEQLYGWSRDEAVGTVTHNLLHTIFPIPLETIKEQLRQTGHWEGELVHIRKDGSQVTVASRWSLQRDDQGQPIGTLETNNDITERKRAEEALRRSQAAYLAEAQKLSQTGSFGWNTAGGEVFWSDQSFDILGYDQTVTPSLDRLIDRVHPDDMALARTTFEVAAHDRSGFDIEFRLAMPGSVTKHIHAVAHVMEDAPDTTQFVGALMDVTKIRQAETQLHQAEAQVAHVARVTSLGALSASIAHEVNQPLAAIVSHGEASLRWLNRDPPRLDEVEASIRHIVANGKRASEVIQRIRALTSGTVRQRSPLNLNAVVEEVVPLVRREVARHRATLQLDLASDLPDISGDEIQLQQVIINLVLNAAQAMVSIEGRPRSVVVGTRMDETDHVVLDVTDSGSGIAPEHAAQLFDAFFTTKPNGMGMGLSICRQIVEAHGGQISALARSPEPGTSFRCRLPRCITA
jgi:PAS domain S-box-containing protein